jgi:peptidoglycan hydrolase CwlO-like protein
MSAQNNGGKTDYYDIPSGSTTLNDLIEYKNMPFWRGEILKAIYGLEGRMQKNKDEKNAEIRELNKIIYYANRRLRMIGDINN